MSSEHLAAVEAEAETEDGIVTVELAAGVTVDVLPANKWRSSAIRAMRDGDFDSWAEKCLASAEDYAAWRDVDPDVDECEVFFRKWGEATGQDRGKSRASQRSSRSTARR